MKKKTKLTPYLYVIPGLLMVLGFVYIPIIVNLVYSFFPSFFLLFFHEVCRT